MATDVLTADPATKVGEAARIGGGVNDLSAGRLNGAGQGSAEELDSGTDNLERANPGSFSAACSDYVQLTKPRIVVMILVTTTATAMLGAGGWVAAGQLFWLLIATAAVAGSAGAANQVWERVIDRRMTRTAGRPIPSRRLSTIPAVIYTAALGTAGTIMLHMMFGAVPALVGLATWFIYVLVYTPLKTRTQWNTTVGAVSGALPVLIGYTATGGSLTDATGWLLFGVLAAWQYPHFMSIAWIYRRQYDEAGFRMTTTVEPSGRSAGWQSIAGSLALIACAITMVCLTGSWLGAVIASAAVLASTIPMLQASIRFAADPGDTRARRLLRSSLLVLPAVLAVVTLRLFW